MATNMLSLSPTDSGASLSSRIQEWPTDLKAWWKMGTAVEGGDQRMFADGWWQMRSAFSEQGVFLFNPYGAPAGQDQSFRFPCDGLMGRSSEYVHEIIPDKTTKIQQLSPYIYPARLRDGTDGMVRVVADGSTSRELEILRFLTSVEALSNPENHTIPVLCDLSFGKWQFVVFPLVGTDPCRPWFNCVAEAVDCIGQTLEGLAFMHQNLIAHRDIAESNILINHKATRPQSQCPEFRSLFPVRYYFTDFEYSIRFAQNSDPATRVVSRVEEMTRFGAPETRGTSPYCPFAADVFSLGYFFFDNFRQLEEDLGPIVQIFRDMLASDPKHRVSALNALLRFRVFESDLMPAILQRSVPPRIICHDDDQGVESFLTKTLPATSVTFWGNTLTFVRKAFLLP